MKIKFLILTILAVFLAGAVNLSAFCVYNNTDKKIYVKEISGGGYFSRFESEIEPGEKDCCSWKNKGCNKKKKRDSKLKFLVKYLAYAGGPLSFEDDGYLHLCKKSIKAGGELIVTGKKGKYNCRAKGY